MVRLGSAHKMFSASVDLQLSHFRTKRKADVDQKPSEPSLAPTAGSLVRPSQGSTIMIWRLVSKLHEKS